MMHAVELPAPAGQLAFSIVDHRKEPRFVCQGDVRITAFEPGSRHFGGELLDISNHGFRVSYNAEMLPSGAEVSFAHRFFRGRARVMWSRHLPDHNESGCMVLR
ncbi:MAG: PilZ domain-containing protein [Bryobacteraceae bacterium]|nr:PilZ domain-containing protein [Bryobacteraceae bacterium]